MYPIDAPVEFLLLLVEVFGWALVLLVGAIGVLVWALIQIARSLARSFDNTQKSDHHRAFRPVNQWDPNHPLFSKRAGQ